MQPYLFFDLDGTLLVYHEDGPKITDHTKTVLRKLQDSGFKLYIASGRPWAFLDQDLISFGFDGYILVNGACVYEHDQILAHHPLGEERVKEVVQNFEKRGLEYVYECQPYSYLKEEFKKLETFYARCSVDFDKIERLVPSDVAKHTLKLEAWHDTPENNAYIESLKNMGFGIMGGDLTYEIYDATINKATGIQDIMQAHHVPKEMTYAFGDNLNDLEMLATVGHAYAMGNAIDEIKAIADEVVGRNDEDGVAIQLEKLFL